MAAYGAAKLRLFGELLPADGFAVASTALDATTLASLRAVASQRGFQLETVGAGGSLLDLLQTTPVAHGQVLNLHTRQGPTEIALPLAGSYQADNVLMAAGLALVLETPDVLRALPMLKGVHGRLELIATLPAGGAAYIDYAHTPDALSRMLQSLRPHCAGRLILVFGAGGDRDPGKRPLMGREVANLADIAIVTDDNPRRENPAAIRAAILAACPGAREIGDRRDAIAAGLDMLRPGDVLVVAGKGHERGQTIGTTTLPFDDADTIRRLAGAA
jgi:UDP-N-acetylmuramoyl-L-alanyl-D-glutamate--2,6-diaminopimelate ligase